MGRRLNRNADTSKAAPPRKRLITDRLVGVLGLAFVAATIVAAGVLIAVEAPVSETRVLRTVMGMYQPPSVDSDVPNPLRFLIRLDSGEQIEATPDGPVAFRPGKRVEVIERTMRFSGKFYRMGHYIEEEKK